MQHFPKLYVYYELKDGTEHVGRVLAPDQIALNQTATERRWNIEKEDAWRTPVFWAWRIASREGHTDVDFNEFWGGDDPVLIDVNLKQDEDGSITADLKAAKAANPTKPADSRPTESGN